MIDLSRLRTIPIAQRKNKFTLSMMLPVSSSAPISTNPDLIRLAEDIRGREQGSAHIWMMGGHVIKVGLSDFVIDMMRRGFITHVAMNGAGPIHDFEVAYQGATSEDVATNIEDGTFGMAYETGHFLHLAAKEAVSRGEGYGAAVGRTIGELDCSHKEHSILYNAFKLGIPATVHTAIGAEIIYQHPECSAAALGEASYTDFRRMVESISKLQGGVVSNVGCAVILPEVFLKAFTVARNLGYTVERFSAANLDMIDHYRPRVNVVERPTSLGGKGYFILDKHENTVPTLHYHLTH